MRRGLTPQKACLETLQRVVAMTERRLLDDRGHPRFDLTFYAVAKDGAYGSASIYSGKKFAVADAKGARVEECAFLFKREDRPRG
jgi:N4-(beta-N-acetylglucosaminyl)-L-asparaginase